MMFNQPQRRSSSPMADDPEDSEHSPAERIAAASRSTWVSVGVNLILTIAQVAVGILGRWWRIDCERAFVPLHVVGGQAREVEHAGGQCLACTFRRRLVAGGWRWRRRQPVSYTHLTLPTNR